MNYDCSIFLVLKRNVLKNLIVLELVVAALQESMSVFLSTNAQLSTSVVPAVAHCQALQVAVNLLLQAAAVVHHLPAHPQVAPLQALVAALLQVVAHLQVQVAAVPASKKNVWRN